MKKLLLLLILFIASPKIGINVEASNSIASICNIMKKGVRFLFIGKETLDLNTWENNYRQLLDQLRAANPDVIFALGTPFVAKVGRIGAAENFQLRKELISECVKAVRHIATDYNAVLLDYEKMFNVLAEDNPSYWIWDGIHPTAAGHQKMADLWLNTFK